MNDSKDVVVADTKPRVMEMEAGTYWCFSEMNADNAFDAFESVFPGDDQPHWRAVLVWQVLTIESSCH